jgi:hypothetical protein
MELHFLLLRVEWGIRAIENLSAIVANFAGNVQVCLGLVSG